MKATRISYWILTAIVGLMMLYSAYAYLYVPQVAEGFVHLGFPSFFRVELAVWKIIGALLLLLPMPSLVKEWAYAGFAITFISAFVAHTASGDPVSRRMLPVIFLLILIGSYVTWHRSRAKTA
jgi:hypothetical protein